MRCLLCIPLLLLLPALAAAQQPSLGVAADVGPAIPLGQFADDGASVGWSVGASANVQFTRVVGIYASFERASFGISDSAGAPGDGTWTDTGIGAGLRFHLPVREEARLQPWVQAGMGWHNTDPPIAGPQFAAVDTDGIRTFEGAGGLDIALAGQSLRLRPALRYRNYRFRLETPAGTESSRISSITLALGLAFVVGRGGAD